MTEFDQLYEELVPILDVLEKKRIELKAQGEKMGKIAGLIFVLILETIMIINARDIPPLVFFIPFFFWALIYYVSVNSMSSDFSVYYKKDIITKVVKEISDTSEYKPNSGITEDDFNTMRLFNSPDRYYSEDLITGKIEKTDYRCSEVIAEEHHITIDNKGRVNEYWEDIFRGFIFIADFHKNFNGITTIGRDSLFKISFGNKRVKLENVEFERHFDVYSSDGVEARYILSPVLMEKLVELDNRFKGDIVISFVNSSIFLAIPDTKNHFEASIWNKITKEKIQEDFGLILSLISIVNELNLNTRIWSKQ
jgi:Protein of unknown function (DUF3137).